MTVVVRILYQLFNIYTFILVIYVLLSWFPHDRGFMRDLYNVLGSICEPFLGLFRRFIPPIGGNGFAVDISPIIAIIVLQLVVQIVARLLLAL